MQISRRYLSCIVAVAILNIAFVSLAYSQLDPTFGTDGIATVVTPGNEWLIGSFILPDGKILVVDNNLEAGTYAFFRFNANGTPDTGYGTNGRVPLSIPFIIPPNVYPYRFLFKAIRQIDGKIVLLGTDNDDGLIVRLNEDGSFDNSFSDDGISRPNINQLGNDGLSDVVQQPDGKLLALGYINDGSSHIPAIRYETNGELDTTFGDHGGYIVNDVGGVTRFHNPTMALQSNGKFLALSTWGSVVFRFNADGTLDNTFTSPSPFGQSLGIRVVGDDKFMVFGLRSYTNTLFRTNDDLIIRRYEPDGNPDLTFGSEGAATIDVTSHFSDQPFDVVEQPDGKIVVGAVTDVPANRSSIKGGQVSLIRLNENGSVDGKYLVTGVFTAGILMLQTDGKIVTATTALRGNETDPVLTRSIGVPSPTYRFHGIPFQLYYVDRAVAAIFRPGNMAWYTDPGTGRSIFFGLEDDILVPSDYFGSELSHFSLASEVAVFRPSNGTWYIGKDYDLPAYNFVAVQWGTSGDITAPADYDGDGKSDLAVFRPSTGIWYIKNIGDNSAWALQWGLNGDKPVVGDYDGDGIYDVAVWRPSDGFWYILRSSDGQPMYVQWGIDGDSPVQEDYDGDGKFDIAVWRPSNGFWYILRSSDGGITYFQWGLSTDIAAPADYDGDHIADFAVWRPSSQIWYIKYSSGLPTYPLIFGSPGDVPIPGRN